MEDDTSTSASEASNPICKKTLISEDYTTANSSSDCIGIFLWLVGVRLTLASGDDAVCSQSLIVGVTVRGGHT